DPLVAAADRVALLAAQASRPLSETDPDYTEETNLTGVRRVAQAVAANGCPPVVFGSSLHVYGPGLAGKVGPDTPYGEQGDLAHLSKIYGELALTMFALAAPFDLAIARAVAAAPVVAEYLVPLLNSGGEALLYRGQWGRSDDQELERAAVLLKARISRRDSLELPAGRGQRTVLGLRPQATCPATYPRAVGIPSKLPLGAG
ncbi:MAG: rRNA ((527)-N(7))-methyltransferase RsmG, partial [Cyanobacteriota bacterium]